MSEAGTIIFAPLARDPRPGLARSGDPGVTPELRPRLHEYDICHAAVVTYVFLARPHSRLAQNEPSSAAG